MTKLIVLLVFAGLTAFAIWAATQVELDIKAKNFVNKDSESKKYLEAMEMSFPDLGSTAGIFTNTEVDIRSNTEQIKLFNLLKILSG